jgi:hypothetical protein
MPRKASARATDLFGTNKNGLRAKIGALALGLTAAAVVLMFVLAPLNSAGASAQSTPLVLASSCSAHITSVTGLTVKNIYHKITILGTCFGKHPTYVDVSTFSIYTGMDTQNCGLSTAPVLHIGEWGAKTSRGDWASGRILGSGGVCSGGDAIGLFFTKWTPTEIVIAHGFGDALGTSTQNTGAPWLMMHGAQCAVYVINPPGAGTNGIGYNYTMPSGTC